MSRVCSRACRSATGLGHPIGQGAWFVLWDCGTVSYPDASEIVVLT
jgi:hypothetical protein